MPVPSLDEHLSLSVTLPDENQLRRAVRILLGVGTCFAVIGNENEIRTTERGAAVLQDTVLRLTSPADDAMTDPELEGMTDQIERDLSHAGQAIDRLADERLDVETPGILRISQLRRLLDQLPRIYDPRPIAVATEGWWNRVQGIEVPDDDKGEYNCLTIFPGEPLDPQHDF